MRVVEGSSLELGDGSWVKPEVELDSSDFEKLMAEWGVSESLFDSIPLILRYEVLSALARVLIWKRLTSAARNDVNQKGWLETVGMPMLKAAADEYGEVSQKVKAAIS
ncbi:MAG: hypothetical protein WC054_00470 [Candidatus Nanopelagicales bacterium]